MHTPADMGAFNAELAEVIERHLGCKVLNPMSHTVLAPIWNEPDLLRTSLDMPSIPRVVMGMKGTMSLEFTIPEWKRD